MSYSKQQQMMTGISKSGYRLTYTLEETKYYATIREMYRDILDTAKEINDKG